MLWAFNRQCMVIIAWGGVGASLVKLAWGGEGISLALFTDVFWYWMILLLHIFLFVRIWLIVLLCSGFVLRVFRCLWISHEVPEFSWVARIVHNVSMLIIYSQYQCFRYDRQPLRRWLASNITCVTKWKYTCRRQLQLGISCFGAWIFAWCFVQCTPSSLWRGTCLFVIFVRVLHGPHPHYYHR